MLRVLYKSFFKSRGNRTDAKDYSVCAGAHVHLLAFSFG
jgi:hypothetical protein